MNIFYFKILSNFLGALQEAAPFLLCGSNKLAFFAFGHQNCGRCCEHHGRTCCEGKGFSGGRGSGAVRCASLSVRPRRFRGFDKPVERFVEAVRCCVHCLLVCQRIVVDRLCKSCRSVEPLDGFGCVEGGVDRRLALQRS